MSPDIAIVAAQPPRWFRDVTYPSRSLAPIQGQTTGRTTEFMLAEGYDMGLDSSAAPQPLWRQGELTSGAGTAVDLGQWGGLWAARNRGTTGATFTEIYRFPTWTPALDPASAPLEDDDAHRIAWLRVWLYTDPAGDPALEDDRIGVTLGADDGSLTATDAITISGGFGIFQRLGGTGWRYASYSPAVALLESIDLDDSDGWHVADFIFRQARRGDLATPWLTVRWDGVDVITERAFGHALLPAPAAFLAAAQSWACIIGGRIATAPWAIVRRQRFRQGPFHPDGYPVP